MEKRILVVDDEESGELPLELQVKMLRLIQQGEIEKVGATETETVDVRVIAATHRNLAAMTEDGMGPSGRTCTTGSRSSRWTCRRSGRGLRTSRN
jgi:sigma54-dependent transcription regulator